MGFRGGGIRDKPKERLRRKLESSAVSKERNPEFSAIDLDTFVEDSPVQNRNRYQAFLIPGGGGGGGGRGGTPDDFLGKENLASIFSGGLI